MGQGIKEKEMADKKPFEVDLITRIYFNCGYYYEIGPDPDGLSVEIRYYDREGQKEPTSSILITTDMIDALIDALQVQKGRIA
jgi:hypothetical protein